MWSAIIHLLSAGMNALHFASSPILDSAVVLLAWSSNTVHDGSMPLSLVMDGMVENANKEFGNSSA